MTGRRISIAATIGVIAAALIGAATITTIPTLPDSAGVFTIANHDQINTNIGTENTNFANVNTQLAALAAGTGIGAGSLTGAQMVNNTVGSTQLALNTIQFTSVPLTLSQLQTLNSIPVQVIAAQGAGTLVELQSCTLDLIRGSAAFTGGGTVTLGYDTGASPAAAATIASTVFTTFAASQAITVAGALAVNATSGILNKAIYAKAASADFASGTGGSGILDCAYRVHSGLS